MKYEPWELWPSGWAVPSPCLILRRVHWLLEQLGWIDETPTLWHRARLVLGERNGQHPGPAAATGTPRWALSLPGGPRCPCCSESSLGAPWVSRFRVQPSRAQTGQDRGPLVPSPSVHAEKGGTEEAEVLVGRRKRSSPREPPALSLGDPSSSGHIGGKNTNHEDREKIKSIMTTGAGRKNDGLQPEPEVCGSGWGGSCWVTNSPTSQRLNLRRYDVHLAGTSLQEAFPISEMRGDTWRRAPQL